jgi:guanylate kinase
MRDTILALVGASGTGKTSVAKLLERDGIHVIKSYTTRPPRSPGEWGHIYVEKIPKGHKAQMIAYTKFNNYEYWAIQKQYRNKGWSVYVIDPDGVRSLREKVSVKTIVVALIADEARRRERMLQERDHSSTVQRIHHDRECFKFVECNYIIDTNYLSPGDVAQLIKLIMLGEKT